MTPLVLLMLAAAPVHGASVQATASATILPAERIDFSQDTRIDSAGPGQPRRSEYREVRRDGTVERGEIRLIEFE